MEIASPELLTNLQQLVSFTMHYNPTFKVDLLKNVRYFYISARGVASRD